MLHHVRLSHCDHGVVDMEAFVVTDRNTDLVWATDMCMNSQMCFRAVRYKKYARRSMNIYLPYTAVGGIFLCPGNNTVCTNENARPILPLIADRIWLQWYDFPKYRRIVQRIPYLSTPNYVDPRYPHRQDKGAEWASKLDINEDYEYSMADSLTISAVVNRVLDVLNNIFSISPGYLVWEHDPVVTELRKDTRDTLAPKLMRKLLALLMTPGSHPQLHRFLQAIQTELEPLDSIHDDTVIQHAELLPP
ncbi:Uncharacterized protein YGL138C [Sugiyamaella lignohabitans]|uniref:Uncharacterized protein YGL138C n=1 Tax=Sugiyamaella lignohabitans TaxID=796027 RepID=A0A167EKU2_9ASCO|nr:Uncharacterized protein YGL138C [Sugiyamaella lignohabitans]ANB14193.1 Uncharacterized protein YGL138C [Sugiyamaella lignohabitans]